MRKLALAFLLLLLSVTPALAQRTCDQWTFDNFEGPIGPKEIVPAKQGQRVYICGYALGGAGNLLNFQLWAGTGEDCADDRAPITPLISLGQSSQFVNRVGVASAEKTPPGQALCWQASGASTIKLTVTVYWTQF
jgi:hypothetical protein